MRDALFSFPQMLRKLLQSKNPEDLRAANRLIRDMVRRVSESGTHHTLNWDRSKVTWEKDVRNSVQYTLQCIFCFVYSCKVCIFTI